VNFPRVVIARRSTDVAIAKTVCRVRSICDCFVPRNDNFEKGIYAIYYNFALFTKSFKTILKFMKLVLEIQENRLSFFMELLKSFSFVRVVNEPQISEVEQELSEAFDDVKQHESGKKSLKTAQDFLDEL
jgi:hypothetical protein